MEKERWAGSEQGRPSLVGALEGRKREVEDEEEEGRKYWRC